MGTAMCSRMPFNLAVPNSKELLTGALVDFSNEPEKIKVFLSKGKREVAIPLTKTFKEYVQDKTLLEEEVWEYIQFLVEQAPMDIANWIWNYSSMVGDNSRDDKFLSINDLEQAWEDKKKFFGMFRICCDLGLSTSFNLHEAKPVRPKFLDFGETVSYSVRRK